MISFNSFDVSNHSSFTQSQGPRLARLAYHALLLFALSVGASACTATSKYMTAAPSPASAPEPTSDSATVVFLRPSGLGSMITFMIIDQNGHFVGDSTSGGHFLVELPPGEYLFIAEGENTAVMHANLAPNYLYFVEVDPKMGVFSARVGLQPIKPGSKDWPKVPEMLSSTKRFVPIVRAGQAKLDADASAIQKRIANAKGKWAGYSPAEKAELSLEPGDGEKGAAPVAPQPVVPPVVPQTLSPAGQAPTATPQPSQEPPTTTTVHEAVPGA